ncbi:MAG: glycosyltransferase 87 family protein [Ktedonobacterales bacterium]
MSLRSEAGKTRRAVHAIQELRLRHIVTASYRPAFCVLVLLCAGIYGYLGIYLPLRAGGYDFTGPYEAAYALAHHVSLPVYDVAQQRLFNAAVLHLPQGPSDFRWTPQTAALLIPLGFLPYSAAHIIWFLVSQAATLASLVLLARCVAAAAGAHNRTLLPLSSTGGAFATLLCFAVACQPLTDSLRLGQSTPLLLLGFVLVLYGTIFDHPLLAGAGLALAILLKLFPAALIPYYLWRGRYRICAIAIGAIAALTILTLPLTGAAIYGAFARAVNTYGDQPNAGKVNLSLYHALLVGPNALLRPGQMEPSGGVAAALALFICVGTFAVFLLLHGRPALLSRRARNGAGERFMEPPPLSATLRARRELLTFGWAMCALLLLEPIDWIFYFLALLIPLGYLLVQLQSLRVRPWRVPEGRLLLVGFLAYLAATFPLPLDSRIVPYTSFAYVVGICLRPIAVLVLWLVLARLASRKRTTGDSNKTLTISLPALDGR